ncbi:hypothetical protein H8N03_24440 [Ramlibacter sp. USB13]|uniref:Uncharacterized protein n=1 Tax=Ramlibacter cellulosilyticus TaxID=2764187 RepID=A0A923MVE5_9BURK|nr:hypothetical protein [Ramlibacter cellulosilyticus]MBC5786110.1 hypothetical protein [Ramlibacter cellulosilyticus]
MIAVFRPWQISTLALLAFALALVFARPPITTVGLGVAVALAVAVRVVLEAWRQGRGGDFAQLTRIGKPLGFLALGVAGATLLIEILVHGDHPLGALFDSVFAAVLLLALDGIVRKVLGEKGKR